MAYQEKLEKLKKFGLEVWQEMERQPDVFVAGFGAGTVLHAADLTGSGTGTVDQAADCKGSSLAQKIPHLAVCLGIYTLYKNRLDEASYIPSMPNIILGKAPSINVQRSATAANIVAGAATAYLTLSLVNAFLKP